MPVSPAPSTPPEAANTRPAKPVPLRPGTHGEVIVVAVTSAVARLARVAQAVAEERLDRRLGGLAGTKIPNKADRSERRATFTGTAGLRQTKADRIRTLVR